MIRARQFNGAGMPESRRRRGNGLPDSRTEPFNGSSLLSHNTSCNRSSFAAFPRRSPRAFLCRPYIPPWVRSPPGSAGVAGSFHIGRGKRYAGWGGLLVVELPGAASIQCSGAGFLRSGKALALQFRSGFRSCGGAGAAKGHKLRRIPKF